MQLHHFACSYFTLSPPVAGMTQTLETTLKISWENKSLKVIFTLTLDTALCFTSKNSCAATVIRIGNWWVYYLWGDIFTDLSLYVCLCIVCARVHQLSLMRWFCWVHSRPLTDRSWIWGASPAQVIPLSRFDGGWATRSSTPLLSLWRRWDYTVYNFYKAQICLSEQVRQHIHVGKRQCKQWVIIGDHAGQYKEKNEKVYMFLFCFCEHKAKVMKNNVQKHYPSVKLAFKVPTKNY